MLTQILGMRHLVVLGSNNKTPSIPPVPHMNVIWSMKLVLFLRFMSPSFCYITCSQFTALIRDPSCTRSIHHNVIKKISMSMSNKFFRPLKFRRNLFSKRKKNYIRQLYCLRHILTTCELCFIAKWFNKWHTTRLKKKVVLTNCCSLVNEFEEPKFRSSMRWVLFFSFVYLFIRFRMW